MGDGSHELPVLDDWAAAHPLHNAAGFCDECWIRHGDREIVGIVRVQRANGDRVSAGFSIVERTPDIRVSLLYLRAIRQLQLVLRDLLTRYGIEDPIDPGVRVAEQYPGGFSGKIPDQFPGTAAFAAGYAGERKSY